MAECGHLMGHLAIPNKDGVLTYLPIRCNHESGHRYYGKHDPRSQCSYVDDRSGLEVTDCAVPSVSVDERGCVVTP